MTTQTSLFKPKLWVPGDWNAFFGFGTNILVNVLTLTGLLRFVLDFPDELVFGRILPAVGLMLCMSTFYYAYLAYKLAKETGRTDVCAMPSGPGVGHMFICVFAVMLPIKVATGDPIKAWEAGLTWVFIQSLVLLLGGFCGKWIRKITPRAALLGTLAGVAITFISMRPILQMYLTPAIGLLCFFILMINWLGGFKYIKGLPAGLVALLVGTVIAWGSNFLGYNFGGLSLSGLTDSIANFGFRIPVPAFNHTFSGFEFLGVLLVTAIPFGLYDLVEAIDNVESAAAAGDSYPTFRVLAADGIVSMIGCLMGNPFTLAVYIGHPGWKAMGGRIGYSLATGVMVILLCWFGTVSVMVAAIPVVAILPILLYIGMLIGSQAFQETPARHAPAVVLAIIPHIAHWAAGMLDNTIAATGVAKTPELMASLENAGILLGGLHVLGDGAVLTGIILAASTVFIIERQLWRASITAALGGIFTFFGLMHGAAIGIAVSVPLALSYFTVAIFLALATRFEQDADFKHSSDHGH
jgi:AGZA family xanthine/uracil permease-like MFS transporter